MSDNYVVLSRKWRPQSFDDVVGQLHVTQTLQNAINQNRLGHGYLFTGSRGVGKTSVARILSRAINCPNPKESNPCNECPLCIDILNGNNFDVVELDGASNRGIDEIRDLRESVKYAPSSGKYKIYIIDEVHMLTKEAFNALLKTLEEPPTHVLFILATTDPHKIPQTILSRTQRFNFKRISIEDINNYLSKILNHEGKEFDSSSLKLISKKADGSMRDALSLLDQVIAYCDESVNVKTVSEAIGLIDSVVYSKIVLYILKSDLTEILSTIDNSLSTGYSINDFVNGFIDFLNRCMHFYLKDNVKDDTFFDNEVKYFLEKIKDKLDIEFIVKILDSMLKFQNKLKFVNQPMIALEAQFIKLAYLNKSFDYSSNEDEILENLQKKSNQGDIKIDTVNKRVVDNPSLAVKDSKSDVDVQNKDISSIKEDSEKNNHFNADSESESIIKESLVKGRQNVQPSLGADKESDSVKDEGEANVNTEKKDIVDGEPTLITIDSVKQKWNLIMDLIEQEHPKTSSFLNDVTIEKIEKNNLTLSIINGSQFHINTLENDINIINDSFSDLLGSNVSVSFQIKSDNNIKKDIENKPKQHPLINKAIDLLDGEVI